MQQANYRRWSVICVVVLAVAASGCDKKDTAIPVVAAPSSAASSGSAPVSASSTPTVTPSPTKSMAPSASPSPPPCRTVTSPKGTVAYGPYTLEQNVWNPVHPVSQTMRACSASSWSVVTKAASTNDGYTAQSDPDVYRSYSQPASSLPHEYVSFGESSPELGVFGWSIDSSFNNQNSDFVMVTIWTDDHGLSVEGTQVGGPITLEGTKYNIFESNGFQFVFTPLDHSTMAQGTIDLVPFWNYAVGKGWIKSPQTLTQVAYGVNISDTSSLPEKFTVSQFAISASS